MFFPTISVLHFDLHCITNNSIICRGFLRRSVDLFRCHFKETGAARTSKKDTDTAEQ